MDYELKIDPIQLPADMCMNGKPVTVAEEDEDDCIYSMEELETLIEKAHQEEREGKTIPYDDALKEEFRQMIARMEERERQKAV